MDVITLGIETSFDSRYAFWLKKCYEYAHTSKHTGTHNASLLIKDGEIILKGVNNLPDGVLEKPIRVESPGKHIYPNHAERDLIFKAAKLGIATNGLTMVMPWIPCISCANAVISSGVKILIVHKTMVERTKEKWQEELTNAIEIMHEAGVKIIAYDGVLGVKAFMHREEWDA